MSIHEQTQGRIMDMHLQQLSIGMEIPESMLNWLGNMVTTSYPTLNLAEAMVAYAFIAYLREHGTARSDRTLVRLLLRVIETIKGGDFEHEDFTHQEEEGELCNECYAVLWMLGTKCPCR